MERLPWTKEELKQIDASAATVGTPPKAAEKPAPGYWWVLLATAVSVPSQPILLRGEYFQFRGHADWTTPMTHWEIIRVNGDDGYIGYDIIGSDEGEDWQDAYTIPIKVGPRIVEPEE